MLAFISLPLTGTVFAHKPAMMKQRALRFFPPSAYGAAMLAQELPIMLAQELPIMLACALLFSGEPSACLHLRPLLALVPSPAGGVSLLALPLSLRCQHINQFTLPPLLAAHTHAHHPRPTDHHSTLPPAAAVLQSWSTSWLDSRTQLEPSSCTAPCCWWRGWCLARCLSSWRP